MNGVGGCVISEDGDQTEDELKAWMSIRGGRRFTERVSCPNLGGELAGEVNSPTTSYNDRRDSDHVCNNIQVT